jgi:hypothetical protein
MRDITQIKRSRLRREIANLKHEIKDIKDMIKHDPYPEDQPGLKRQLSRSEQDLKFAVNDLGRLP